MGLASNLSPFFIGAGAGLLLAVLGALLEYRLHLRPGAAGRTEGLPSCLLFAAGGLAAAVMGVVLVAIVAFSTNNDVTLHTVVTLGGGFLAGFYGGFIALFGLWFLLDR